MIPAAKVERIADRFAEIEAALSRSKGNVMQAARQLKTHAKQLYRWIERLSLPLDKYRT